MGRFQRVLCFDVDHSWQFKDSGSYREIDLGPRKYAKTTRENYQSFLATVRYEIGNVFDPAYTVVCKVAKRVLAQLTR
jgi:hypothetical protein